MATVQTAPVVKNRLFLRVGFPLVVLAVSAVATTLVWTWPAGDLERVFRVILSLYLILPLTVILLVFWWVLLSGIRWWLALVTLPVLIAIPMSLIDEVKFSGDMVPQVHFRWQSRKAPPGQPADTPVDLGDEANNFPEYRNRNRDGVVHGPALNRNWDKKSPKLVWKQPVGGGYAGFAVVGNLAITIEQRGDKEAVVCYDTATGKERWVHDYTARFDELLGGSGPRATPTIADNEVYALGATGQLWSLDLKTGEPRWKADVLAGHANVHWAMSGSPLVYDDVVVVSPGTQTPGAGQRTLVAYSRKTGTEVWAKGDHRAGYSSPMLATLGGKRQVLLFDGEGIGGYDAKTGEPLWWYEWETNQGINVAQPVVLDGERIFVTSGYGVGDAVLSVKEEAGKWTVSPLWSKKTMRCRFTSPVAYEKHLYGLDEGVLVCVDEQGERKWRRGNYGHGQLLRSGDLLVILSESGELALVEATPEEYRELGRIQAIDGKTWNYLALAGGRAYVRNDQEMACYDLR